MGNRYSSHCYYRFYQIYIMIIFTLAVIVDLSSAYDERIQLWIDNHQFSHYPRDIISNRRLQNDSIVSEEVCPYINSPMVIIAIFSALQNTNKRFAIRNTWRQGSYEKYKIKVVFMLGSSTDTDTNLQIEKESSTYHDIIIADFIDSYHNLTLKSIYLLKWMIENCQHVDFLLKCDDDLYVNTENLANFIERLPWYSKTDLLTGKLYKGNRPIRSPVSKWYMPRALYKYPEYPNYLSGAGYLMSMTVARRLYYTARNVQMLYLEDVFITGIVARLAGVRITTNRRFDFIYRPKFRETFCNPTHASLILVYHYVQWYNMYRIHYELQECNYSKFLWFNLIPSLQLEP